MSVVVERGASDAGPVQQRDALPARSPMKVLVAHSVYRQRGETATPDKMQMRIDSDMAYIRTWSWALDIRILLATIPAVLTGRAAF